MCILHIYWTEQVAMNLSTAAKRQAAMDEMVNNADKYFLGGQVRSMPFPDYWDRCDFTPAGQGDKTGRSCAGHGTYQNGAFWATPLSYVTSALLATKHSQFAETLLADAISNFVSQNKSWHSDPRAREPSSLQKCHHHCKSCSARKRMIVTHRCRCAEIEWYL